MISSCAAYAQGSNPNIDFEQGTTDYWKFYIGHCCPINTPTVTAALPTRHQLVAGTAVDPYGGFPVVAPDGAASL